MSSISPNTISSTLATEDMSDYAFAADVQQVNISIENIFTITK